MTLDLEFSLRTRGPERRDVIILSLRFRGYPGGVRVLVLGEMRMGYKRHGEVSAGAGGRYSIKIFYTTSRKKQPSLSEFLPTHPIEIQDQQPTASALFERCISYQSPCSHSSPPSHSLSPPHSPPPYKNSRNAMPLLQGQPTSSSRVTHPLKSPSCRPHPQRPSTLATQ